MKNSANIPNVLSQAIASHRAGNLEDAETLYRSVLASDPKNPDALNLLGAILLHRGHQEEGLRLIESFLKINPNQPDALNNRGVTLQGMERFDEALADYDKAILLRPGFAEAYYNRGNALQELRRYEDALVSYDKAIALKSDYAEAYNSRGNALQEMKRHDEALASYAKAIALKPDHVEAYSNRGVTLTEMKRYDEALASYAKAIALKPDYANAYNHRGVTLQEMGRYADALPNFEKALALKPDMPYVLGTLLYTQLHLCKWQGIDQLVEKVAKGIQAGKPVSAPFPLLATPLSMVKQCTEFYVKDKFPPRPVKLWNGERYTHAKIRIAYVSADFREHALSYLMAGVFEQHDKTRFEIYGISLRPEAQDPMGQRLRAAFDHFIDVSQKGDHEVAQLLRNLEIDIAVDLMGFTLGYRINIFAYRPAPVQVNYLGYPATMGAPYIDYIIADTFVIPSQNQPHYSEKVVYLPGCFQANDDRRFISKEKPSRVTYGLSEKDFVFCAFNTTYKITPAFFDIWMRLLKAVPGSVLWLLGDRNVQHNLSQEAGNRGIESSRLIFAPRVKYEEHLARLQNADLFLDTLPFSAGATASDVLWAGVPLLTCVGQAFAARMAGSLLMAIGLPELITENFKDYEALALKLAIEPERLATIKAKLAQNRATSPLFNTILFTRRLEDAYTKMWEKSQAGELPDYISVAA